MNPISNDPRPRFPWERQPEESGRDYQDFIAWLNLPHRRPLRDAAAKLGLTLSRLRALSSRYHWKTRALAFDNHRADAASEAQTQVLQEEAADWRARAQRFRLDEWRPHQEMLQTALALIDRFERSKTRPPSLSQIARLINLGTTLGRKACGLPLDDSPPPPQPPPWHAEAEAALHRTYGGT